MAVGSFRLWALTLLNFVVFYNQFHFSFLFACASHFDEKLFSFGEK